MRQRFIALLFMGSALVSSALLPSAVAHAQPAAQPTCAIKASPPADMASWAAPQKMEAAGDSKAAARRALAAGQAVTLALLPTPKVAYPLRPNKPGGSVSYGGIVRFRVDQPGTWRVALGSGAWIDVIKDGVARASTAHGHGPDCTGIRKMVDFTLEAGDYLLQVAANGDPDVTLLVTRIS